LPPALTGLPPGSAVTVEPEQADGPPVPALSWTVPENASSWKVPEADPSGSAPEVALSGRAPEAAEAVTEP
ncbi:hypothetical protein, partial [Streptomyces luridiscabiei]